MSAATDYALLLRRYRRREADIKALRAALQTIADSPKGYQDVCWRVASEALGRGGKKWKSWA
jgi:hypothetical protein